MSQQNNANIPAYKGSGAHVSVESSNTYQFRPSKKVIGVQDSYKHGSDYLTADSSEKTPIVGYHDAPVRGKRHANIINPHQERQDREIERQARSNAHNEQRGQRLQEINNKQDYVNGYGKEYVPSKKIVSASPDQMSKQSNTRLVASSARFYAPPDQTKASQTKYSSNIGYTKFDYKTSGNNVDVNVSYAHNDALANETPLSARGNSRRTDAFTTSEDWLTYNSNNTNVSSPTRSPRKYTQQPERESNIITNQSRYPTAAVAPSPNNNVSGGRFAARNAFHASRDSNPIAHMSIANVPTAAMRK